MQDFIPYDDNKTNFELGTLKEGDILGLKELYDYNTTIYNFSADCVSKEEIYFLLIKKILI